jgi:hypothetical protein
MPAITKQLYDVLQPLDSDTRKRAIAATMAMLGEVAPEPAAEKKEKAPDGGDYPTRVAPWMRQNSVTADQLSLVFHSGELIAHDIPGSGKREKTLSAYILTGVGQLLQTGEPRFTDETARQACEQHGCLDSNNHSQTINKKRGNAFTGSVKNGWQLTTPGLKTGADLVKQIASA